MDDWLAETTENPDIERFQDGAFLEWIMYNWSKIRAEDTEPLAGQTLNGVELTTSGMILGAHLIGEGWFQGRYIKSGGIDIPTDGDGTTGTPVTQYIEQFGGYDLTDLSGVDPDIIPAGFASYFVTNHDQGNTFNRHSDDNVDLIGNSNTNDYPMHLGSGNDRVYGFGGDDTVFGASGGNDYLDGGTDDEGDTLSYAEFDGPVDVVLIGNDIHAPSPTPVFRATMEEGTDVFLNFESIVMTQLSDTFNVDPAAEASFQYNGIKLSLGGGDDQAQLGTGADTIFAGLGDDTIDAGGGNDVIFGNAGADFLFGNGGDDFFVFDFADGANVNGGAGRDVAVASGPDGVTVDMIQQELECVIGGGGADTITVGSLGDPLFAAGAGGDDTFKITYDWLEAPRILWGGEGADTFVFESGGVGGIAVVTIDGLTEAAFASLTMADLGLDGLNVDWLRAIIINPDANDCFKDADGTVITSSYLESLDDQPNDGWDFTTQTSDFLGRSVLTQAIFAETMEDLPAYLHDERDEFENVLSISFWTGGFDAYGYAEYETVEYDPDNEADQTAAEDFIRDYYADGVPTYDWQPQYSSPGGPWFVIGGAFSGASLVENGSLTGIFDDPGTTPFDWLLVA